ncbi:hypothetical protein AB0424_28695 [Streptomyces sp. NPDC051180]|uniref:hypothetical protein n=1 Tax=unclassified Streptomyces TaxID=2593676 RepID=UPI00344F2198
MQLTETLMISALEAEAEYQTLRGDLLSAKAKRDTVLYAAWRQVPDAQAVARQLPRTVTVSTIRAAVLRVAPPADFEQLVLLPEFADQS